MLDLELTATLKTVRAGGPSITRGVILNPIMTYIARHRVILLVLHRINDYQVSAIILIYRRLSVTYLIYVDITT